MGGQQLELERAYRLCASKAKRMLSRLSREPQSCAFAEDGDYFAWEEGFFDITNWTTSFFTGMALYAFETTRDTELLGDICRMEDVYEDKVFQYEMDTMHDLGFLYSLYSVALFKLTGSPRSRKTAIKAADELAKRFVLSGNYIRAWGRMDDRDTNFAGLVIIETMMNLPLLFWASETTGNPFYRNIAERHANTTGEHFVREDGSVYHVFRFDETTGELLEADNFGGYGVESCWARGAAWAMYGFALAYRYTKRAEYLARSQKIAEFFIANLDRHDMPAWDFKLPREANPERDSSAAAIAVCGLLELQEHVPSAVYRAKADQILHTLCERYADYNPDCRGILKNGQNAAGMTGYTSWGDYFFMEALARKLYFRKPYW